MNNILSKKYVVYHLHTDYSNANGFADSCSSFKEYIKLAKQQGMTAIAFSEHGNIYDWIKKKQECDKVGLKYIHGVEMYLCINLADDDRGGHIGLYARNWDGVLELNKLVSISTIKGDAKDKSDRHMYYHPRISLEELMNTSDNIIVTSACVLSPLNKWDTDENKKAFQSLIKWMVKNKHRCFFEIQYHKFENQIKYNQKLYQYSQKTGIPLIAGTDTHSSSNYKAECRKILQIYKDSFYGEEDECDLVWKTYDELVAAFKEQGALPEEIYLEAIENTNKFADMIEDFTLDKAFKYPTLYGDNVREQWKQLIYTNFNEKRKNGEDKKQAMEYALGTSISSIVVSALCFFGATFGVGAYSKIEMIGSLCTLMARGAIISMITVITVLPAFLLICDKVICKTTLGIGLKK